MANMKRPRSSRLANKHMPRSSCQSTLIRLPRRPRNTATDGRLAGRIALQHLPQILQRQPIKTLAHCPASTARLAICAPLLGIAIIAARPFSRIDRAPDPHPRAARELDLDRTVAGPDPGAQAPQRSAPAQSRCPAVRATGAANRTADLG